MKNFFSRILFVLENRSLSAIVPLRTGPSSGVKVFFAGKEYVVKGKCPHQGAMLDTARLGDGWLACPWHGCKYDLREGRWVRATPGRACGK